MKPPVHTLGCQGADLAAGTACAPLVLAAPCGGAEARHGA